MNLEGKTLLIPEKSDEERGKVAEAWQASGGKVLRLGRFWDTPGLKNESVCLYGGMTFALVVAQNLGLELISPADDWLLKLDSKWIKRKLYCLTLAETANLVFPIFAKPVVPKTFRASVYHSTQEIAAECAGLESNAKLLISEIVRFEAEARAFISGGQILDCKVYEGNAELAEATEFLQRLIKEESLTIACVMDVGLIAGRGWAIVEANAAWGAGLNGCDPRLILPAIAAATKVSH